MFTKHRQENKNIVWLKWLKICVAFNIVYEYPSHLSIQIQPFIFSVFLIQNNLFSTHLHICPSISVVIIYARSKSSFCLSNSKDGIYAAIYIHFYSLLGLIMMMMAIRILMESFFGWIVARWYCYEPVSYDGHPHAARYASNAGVHVVIF